MLSQISHHVPYWWNQQWKGIEQNKNERRDYLVSGDLLSQSSIHHFLQGLLFTLSLAGQLGTAVTEACNVVLWEGSKTLQQCGSVGVEIKTLQQCSSEGVEAKPYNNVVL